MSFHEQNAKGKAGEMIVRQFYQSRGWTVTDLKQVRGKSGDVVVEKGDKQFIVEVKHDAMAAKTGNCFVETHSKRYDGDKNNYIVKTPEFDWICYVLSSEQLFFMSWDAISAEIEKFKAKQDCVFHKEVRVNAAKYNNRNETYGLLAKIELLQSSPHLAAFWQLQPDAWIKANR
jgi:Holliday junction resolvase-like predicted endonuclease